MHLFVAILENGRHIGFSSDQSDISHANCGVCITICTIHPKNANYLLHCKSVTTYPKGSVKTCHNVISLTTFVVVEKYGVFIIQGSIYSHNHKQVIHTYLLFLWPFPSCRVTGMTDDLSSPHRPVRLLARSQFSTFQISLTRVFPSFFRSSSLPFPWYICLQHFPQYVFAISPHHMPYQINLLLVIFLEACATLVVPRMCSFLILSFRVTPHIHRSILISVTSLRFSCLFAVAHVSAPSRLSKLNLY